MRALMFAAALLAAGTAHAQYNDPSQGTPQTAPPVDRTSPTASDAASPVGAPSGDAEESAPSAAAAAPTASQLAETVALPKCSRKVTDRCAERR